MRIAAILMAGLALASCGEAGQVEFLQYVDGNGNSYRLNGKKPETLEYTAVTPRESSSGVYSGGINRSVRLTVEHLKRLSELGLSAVTNTRAQIRERLLGSGRIFWRNGTNEESVILEMNAPEKLALEEFQQNLVK